MQLETSLLREKFDIREKSPENPDKALEIIALSNRMVITLQAGETLAETYVVRTGNMYSCARFCSILVAEYQRMGPLLSRSPALDWHELWDNSLSSFERLHNPDKWVCLYRNGKIIYAEGEHHPFLDIIEQCDALNKGDYEGSIQLAENAFSQAGRKVEIHFDSNVALVCSLTREESKCSMVIRESGRSNTFNLSITPSGSGKAVEISHGLGISANILEAVQMCYRIGETNALIEMGHLKKYSDEYYLMTNRKKRLGEISAQLNSFENQNSIRYRPERPNFDHIIALTERYVADNLSE